MILDDVKSGNVPVARLWQRRIFAVVISMGLYRLKQSYYQQSQRGLENMFSVEFQTASNLSHRSIAKLFQIFKGTV